MLKVSPIAAATKTDFYRELAAQLRGLIDVTNRGKLASEHRRFFHQSHRGSPGSVTTEQ